MSKEELEELHEQLRIGIVRKIATRVRELDGRLLKIHKLMSVQPRDAGFDIAISDMDAGQFESAFPDERACKAYLQTRRWPDGVIVCPACGSRRVTSTSVPFTWICRSCSDHGHRFSVGAGTVFEHSHLHLRDWFRVLHIVETHPHVHVRDIRSVMPFCNAATVESVCRRLQYALKHSPDMLGGVISGKRRGRRITI